MAKNTDTAAPKKRRWYENFVDAYKVIKRTYSWFPFLLIAAPIIIIGLGVLGGFVFHSMVFWVISGVMLAIIADMALLAFLLRPAMYKQIDGKVGSVYAVISQIKRGWDIEEEPVAVNKTQDLVWRLVGRPGVVLISEGPSNRVLPLLQNEKRKVSRAITNVPVVFIQVGHDEGQVPLTKLNRKLKSLKKVLTKHEVPAVANRLNALSSKALPIPKGVDPYKTRTNRKAMRG
ncbi:DUF4191 domain-containing protein [Actinomycetaceae bacterium MB13-C1-2]|nr:DUF4191 domain-containing protein [Actinomycetaceae bacterium MB13-C1-2]